MTSLEGLFAHVLRVPVDGLDDTTSPKTLAEWNSLRHVELVVAVEDAYGVRFSHAEVLSLESLGSFRLLLGKKGRVANEETPLTGLG
jgi:acyl carrier protein